MVDRGLEEEAKEEAEEEIRSAEKLLKQQRLD